MVRFSRDPARQRVLPLRRVGQRAHGYGPIQQAPGDVSAGVAEGPGDDVRAWSVHGDAPRVDRPRATLRYRPVAESAWTPCHLGAHVGPLM